MTSEPAPLMAKITAVSVSNLVDFLEDIRVSFVEANIDPGTLELDLEGLARDMDAACETLAERIVAEAQSEGMPPIRVEVASRMFGWRLRAARAALEAQQFSLKPEDATVH